MLPSRDREIYRHYSVLSVDSTRRHGCCGSFIPFVTRLLSVLLMASAPAVLGVGPAYDEVAASCNAPQQNAAIFDGDVFLWRDCSDIWHVRGQWSQPDRARILGKLFSSNVIENVSGYGLRIDDRLDMSQDSELLVDIAAATSATGFDFSLPAAGTVCVDLKPFTPNGSIRIGPFATPVTGQVDAITLAPCQTSNSAGIIAPASNSVLGHSTQLFVFDAANLNVVEWWLDLGSSAGADDHFNSSKTNPASNLLVTGLPVDGSVIYATLFYQQSGQAPQSQNYVYTAVSGANIGNSNLPPLLTTPTNQSNTEQDTVSLALTAVDPEGQALINWTASGLPLGLSIDSTGQLSGTLSAPGSAGVHNVSITVTDGNAGNTVGSNFIWTVEPAAMPPSTPPSAPLPQNPRLWTVSAASSAGATVDLNHRIRSDYDYREFFGFNLNWYAFQAQVWNNGTAMLNNISMETQFTNWLPGVRQRFPGGNNSVSWVWDQTQGPISSRSDWESFYSGILTTPHFGIDEFLNYANSINAKSFFHVLNLSGLFPSDIDQIATKEALATNNAALASYLDQQWPSNYPQWQLGNELERQRINFSHQELADRSQASIDAIRAVQPDSRFIAHLREHDYQGDSWQLFMQNMYDDLPQVHDHALFAYYDPSQDNGFIPANPILYWIPWYMYKLQENIDYFENVVRPGQTARIWITEHARRRLEVDWDDPPLDSTGNAYDPTPWLTSNLGGSISTADYLTAIMQVPQVLGSMYHGSPGGPWRLFDDSLYDGDFDPLTIFWTMALLNQNTLANVVATVNESTNDAGYPGNYDTRAVSFHDGNCAVKMWIVNRRNEVLDFRITIPLWSNKAISIAHSSIHGEVGQLPDQTGYEGIVNMTPQSLGDATLSSNGTTTVSLPPSSINVYRMECI